MAAINTIEDLIQLLDDNPQWLEALRVRLLTRELIELPQTFAKFAEATNQRFDRIEGRFGGVEGRLDRGDERMGRIEERLDRGDERMGRIEERLDRGDERMDRIEGHLGRGDERMDRIEGRLDRLTDDVGILKGAHARSIVLREADVIAEDMGLTLLRILSRDDLRALTPQQGVADIPAGQLRSFRLADLIMEVADPDGESSFVAVEISFTVNGRDVTRAVRNAGFLSRFTGRPARAAVAGARLDERVRDRLKSEGVFWYELRPESLGAE